MTTGAVEHKHCFCTVNTVGMPMCCKCGQVLGSIPENIEDFLMWEQMGHKRDEIENERRMKQGDLL